MSNREQDMNKFTPVGPNTWWLSEICVTIVCNQLINIPYIFMHCVLLVLNKSHGKKVQVKNNSFTDCHTKGLVMRVN